MRFTPGIVALPRIQYLGGAVLLANETNGFAVDFKYDTDASKRIAVKSSGVVTYYALDDFLTSAGTSPKQVFNSSGSLVWSPHNMFVNSGSPATQNVTLIVGANYTVTVTGTGSLAGSSGASGTATAGSPATFTATGTTGTFTLTGSLTTIQLNRGSVATSYLATGASALYGLAVNYDQATQDAGGISLELQATNKLLNNETLSTQDVTVTAAVHTLSFWGTGTITLSGVSTAGPLVGTGANDRVSLTFTPTAGTLTLTVSGTVSKAQLEAGATPSSPIPTFGVSVTRGGDNCSFLLNTIPELGSEYSVYARFSCSNSNAQIGSVSIHDGTTANYENMRPHSALIRLHVVTNSVTQVNNVSLGSYTGSAVVSSASRFKQNDFAGSLSGGTVATDTSGDLPTVTKVSFATNIGAVTYVWQFEKVVIVPRAWSNTELQTWSVVT